MIIDSISELGTLIIYYTILMSICWIMGRYSFSLIWIWLFVGLIALKTRLWRQKVERRCALQYTHTREQEFILSQLKDLPAWVDFPEKEKVQWMNKLIRQAWPYMTQYAISAFKETVEPEIRTSMPSTLRNMQFEKLHIGDNPLRVDSIRVFKIEEAGHERIIMDLDIRYTGDCEFIISVNMMKAGIREVQINGIVRAIFGPLSPKPPFIDAVSIFFLLQPSIEFDLTGIGELLELPALSQAVKSVIYKQLNDTCVLPNQFVIPLSPDVDLVQLYTPEPDGAMRIHILEARNLENHDLAMAGQGVSDPYAKITVGAQTFRTRTVDNDLNPVWNEHFEAVIYQVSAQSIRISVYDEDPGSDDLLGEITLDMSIVKEAGVMDQWFPLENAKSGEIHVLVFWLDLTTNPDIINKDNSDESVEDLMMDYGQHGLNTALLMAYVDKAHLSVTHGHKPSPAIELTIGENKAKTYSKSRTEDPVYQEKFFFFIGDAQNQTLNLQARDSNFRHTHLGHCEVHLSQLLPEDKLELYQHNFALTNDKPEESNGHYVIVTLRLRFLQFTVTAEQLHEKLTPLQNLKIKRKKTEGVFQGLRAGLMDMLPRRSSSVQGTPATSRKSKLWQRRKSKSLKSIVNIEDLGRMMLSVLFTQQWNILVVTVHRASDLQAVNDEKNCDPSVEIVLKKQGHTISHKHSVVQYDTLEPVFDESFEFKIPPDDLGDYVLILKLRDNIKYGWFAEKPVLGKVLIDLYDFEIEHPIKKRWFEIMHSNVEEAEDGHNTGKNVKTKLRRTFSRH